MSVVLKSRQVKFRNTGGQTYHGVNAISEQKTADVLNEIEEKGEEVLASIPSDYTELQQEVTDLKGDLNDVEDAIDAIEPGLSDAAKTALLNCFQHVAWIDEHGQTYYDALEDALYAD